MPAVSVIVPAFSGEKLFKRCINSILSQSFTDFELIIIDDGSNDGCAKACDEYALIDKRVKVIHQKNGGVSNARNKGLSLAIGDYIVFCDGDDYFCSNLLNTAYNEISGSGTDIVSYRMKRLAKPELNSDNIYSEQDIYDLDDENRFDFIYKVIRCETGGWQACRSIFSNKIIKDYGVEFCETCHNYAEDLGFTVEYLLYARKIKFINDELYIYDDTREDSMMNKSNSAIRIDDINELSFYLYKKAVGVFPNMKYYLLHHYLIRSHMIDAYKVDSIKDFKVWANALGTVKRNDFFKSQNKAYFDWEKSQLSKISAKKRIKNLTNIEFAVNRYLADENLRRFKRQFFYKKAVRKLFGVLYGS